jgi:hypothetical protein
MYLLQQVAHLFLHVPIAEFLPDFFPAVEDALEGDYLKWEKRYAQGDAS